VPPHNSQGIIVSAIPANDVIGIVDSIVAMHLPNTVESIVTFLGVLRAGMVAVPLLSVCNPRPRSLAAHAEIARSACAKLSLREAPQANTSLFGGSASASVWGWRTPARRNKSSSVAAVAANRTPSPSIMDKASRL
jgi:hypothetical protein